MLNMYMILYYLQEIPHDLWFLRVTLIHVGKRFLNFVEQCVNHAHVAKVICRGMCTIDYVEPIVYTLKKNRSISLAYFLVCVKLRFQLFWY